MSCFFLSGTLVTSATDRQFFLHFSLPLLDKRDSRERNSSSTFSAYAIRAIFNERGKLYTIFLSFRSFQRILLFFPLPTDVKKNENGRKKKKKKEKIRNTSRYAERSFFESKGYLAPVGSIESVRKHFILRLFRWVLGKVTFYLHAFFLLFCITWKSAKNTWGEKSKTALNLP